MEMFTSSLLGSVAGLIIKLTQTDKEENIKFSHVRMGAPQTCGNLKGSQVTEADTRMTS